MSLLELFNNLQKPDELQSGGQRFAAAAIPNYEKHRVAKDTNGTPSLLIAVADSTGRTKPAPISLQHITVQHNLQCRMVQSNGTSEDGQFTVISYKGFDQALNSYFLQMLEPMVAMLDPNPSRQDVSQIVSQIVDLFQALEAAPRKTVQGLWAELYLMARSNDPVTLAKAWHATPQDRYDFNAGSQRIEVKSVSGRVRQHHFSLEQLQPPSGVELLIASLFVERAGAGVSLSELLEQIRGRINSNPGLLLHFDQSVAATLGSGWRNSLQDRFDKQLAEQSLAFYEPTAVPSVGLNLPLEVSEVHFKTDLTGKNRANYSQYRALGGLFQAALR